MFTTTARIETVKTMHGIKSPCFHTHQARDYASHWIAEGYSAPHKDALCYFDAIPRSWALSPNDPYPAPIMAADEGRKRALGAYENRGF